MRRGLMPIAMKYSIDELLDACHYYFKETNRRMTFEYSLVAGVNDQPVHAEELAGRLKGFPCHVNLIPVNPIKERDFKQSMPKSVMEFKKILEKNRVNVTIRREMAQISMRPVDSLEEKNCSQDCKGERYAIRRGFTYRQGKDRESR